MHIRLREVPLRIVTTEKTTWIASTHVVFHKTFKLFWKFPLQQTASKQQKRTLKGFLWSTRRNSRAQKFLTNSHFCVRIFFLYHAVTKKHWSPYLSCPAETLVNGYPETRTALLNFWVPALIWQRFTYDFRRASGALSRTVQWQLLEYKRLLYRLFLWKSENVCHNLGTKQGHPLRRSHMH